MIVTFYSYKGGVGRSQLAAHLAAYLCYYENRRVLILDWDLEAPGIELFFFKDAGEEKRQSLKKGLMDLFINYVQLLRSEANVKEEQLPYFTEEYINTLISTHQGGKIDLITAIKYDNDFSKRINEFDWYDFYENRQGKVYMEFLKDRLNDLPYDYIFIDSRTGVSDYSGICNIQMPQLNVMVMAATYQNIEGSLKVAQNIYKSPYIQSKKYRSNWIMPILSRLDTQDNQGVAKWMAYFRKTFSPFIADYLKVINPDLTTNESMIEAYISATRLDYKTELSYGENILFNASLLQKFEDGTIERQFFNIARMIEVLAQKDSLNPEYNSFSLNEPITFITKFKKTIPKFLTYIPTAQLSFVVSRDNECDIIKKALDTEGGRVTIQGMGGIGKTVLAQLYLDKYKDVYDYIAFVEIPFVIGDDTDKAQALLSAFVYNTALGSNLSFSPEPTNTLIDNFSILMSKLESINTQKNLLIIDNAYDIIEQYLKYLPSKWHILLTSRAIINDVVVHIEPILSSKQLQELFYAHYNLSKEDNELEKIIQTIDANPLVLRNAQKITYKGLNLIR